MKYYSNRAIIAILMLSIGATVTSCSKDSGNSGITAPATTQTQAIKLVNNATFGNILTDSAGKTLYFYSLDANGSSACTGGCLAAWPVFYAENFTLPTGLAQSDFNVITRSDGAKQTTYKGWPLYYYQPDVNAGDIKGDNVGGVWFVAKPDYTLMLANEQLTGNDGVQYTSQYTPGQAVTQYLTDDYGRTLYAYSPDTFKKNNYTLADFSNNPAWPIYSVKASANIPSALDKTQLDTTLIDGHVQLTYKGWPLYFFGPDNQTRGNTKGVSVPTPGVWPVVNSNSAVAPK